MSKHGIDHKHCKWPLGLRVTVMTPQGYLRGKVHKHDRGWKHECSIDFSPNLVDLDGRGLRYCGYVPFRSIRPDPGQERPTEPWYAKYKTLRGPRV